MAILMGVVLPALLLSGSAFADHRSPNGGHHRRLEIPLQATPASSALQSITHSLLPPASAILPTSDLPLPHVLSSHLPIIPPHPPLPSLVSALARPDLQIIMKGDSLQILPPPKAQAQKGGASNGKPSTQMAGSDPNRTFQGPMFMGYYPDWAADTFPPEKLNYALYDWIDFAFAVPTSSYGLEWDSPDAPQILTRLVTSAHLARSKVKLSIGGWTGSKHFSKAVSTAESQEIFARNIVSVYSQYNLDGIDLDWEYPGHEGNRGNVYDHTDTRNYLSFLTTLRNALPPSALITAAVQTFPFTDERGEPLADASGFASILDWVLIMNYDTWGASSAPGPNAPLYDSCGNSTQPEASALASYKAWTKSGFPPSKLVLGLPAYGYVQRTGAQRLRNRQLEELDRRRSGSWRHDSDHYGHGHLGMDDGDDDHDDDDDKDHYGHGKYKHGDDDGDDDEDDEDDDRDNNGKDSKPGSPAPLEIVDDEDQIQFRDLVKQGALRAVPATGNDTFVRFEAIGGFERRWDSCSETPFLRSEATGQLVTYDDPESLVLKTRFAKEAGMLGVNLFDIHGDTDSYDLATAIRRALGLSS